MEFGKAIAWMREGRRLRRSGWNTSEAFIALQLPHKKSKNTLPYIYMQYPVGSKPYPEGMRVPWLASQTDMLSTDWQVVREDRGYRGEDYHLWGSNYVTLSTRCPVCDIGIYVRYDIVDITGDYDIKMRKQDAMNHLSAEYNHHLLTHKMVVQIHGGPEERNCDKAYGGAPKSDGRGNDEWP